MRPSPLSSLVLAAALASVAPPASAAPPVDLGRWMLDSSSAIASTALPAAGTWLVDDGALAAAEAAPADASAPVKSGPLGQVRKLLADFSMSLRDIRYRRGGREPSTGFDCSGFVSYVFRKTLGADLPRDSASQYRAGAAVARADLKVGDLVFFRIRGKRVSHVGIYLGEGRFIHSPSTGKSVSVSRLDETYWQRRYAGAKRPDALS